VREHYESFVRCADGIHWFKNMIVSEEFISLANSEGGREGGRGAGGDAPSSSSSGANSSSSSSSKINQLLEIITTTQEGASHLFLPLLLSLDQQKKTRSARLLLQRLAKGT